MSPVLADLESLVEHSLQSALKPRDGTLCVPPTLPLPNARREEVARGRPRRPCDTESRRTGKSDKQPSNTRPRQADRSTSTQGPTHPGRS